MLIECAKCQARVDGVVLHGYQYRDEEYDPTEVISLLRCPACYSPILVSQTEMAADVLDDPSRLYPPRGAALSPSLPRAVRSSYQEALDCLRAKAFVAATLMCRRTLEAICAEYGVNGANLAKSLKEMKDKNLIESRLFEWADELRLVGNEAAHEVGTVISPEDARDVSDFTHALLEYVFTFRDKFEKFKKRRQAKQTP